MVGWASLYIRGLSLLVRGCRIKPPVVAFRPASLATGPGRSTSFRDPRRDHDPLQLDAAQPVALTQPLRPKSAVYLLPIALSQAISREVCRQGRARRPR